jgi:hypothetical protein
LDAAEALRRRQNVHAVQAKEILAENLSLGLLGDLRITGAQVTRSVDSEGSSDASSPPRRAALWDCGANLRSLRGAPW